MNPFTKPGRRPCGRCGRRLRPRRNPWPARRLRLRRRRPNPSPPGTKLDSEVEMKIVINACYGRFGLSEKAVMRYAELKRL